MPRRVFLAVLFPDEPGVCHGLHPVLLPLLLALVAAAVADEAVVLEPDADEAAVAPPPAVEYGARRPPLRVAGVAAPQEVLHVGDAQVVAEVVLAEEGVRVPGTLLVVAQILCLLLVLEMHDPVVPLQVRLSAGALLTPGVVAPELFLLGRGPGGSPCQRGTGRAITRRGIIWTHGADGELGS